MKKPLLAVLILIGLQTQAQTNLTTAVDFTVTDIHGNTHTLFDYLNNGKHVIVDFFFTTCGPCIASVPTLNQAYTDYGCNTGEVIFLSIDNGDSDAEVLQYENDYGGLLPSVSGNDGGGNAVNSAYGISAYPTVILIAPDQTILEQDIFPVSNITTALPNAGLNMAPCIAPSSFISGIDTICYNQNINAEVSVSFTGTPPFTFVYAIDGIPQPSIVTSSNPHIILTQQGGAYTLSSFNDAGGVGTISGAAAVFVNTSPIDCPPSTSIQEQFKNKELLKITGLLGREAKETKNKPLFYIYDDGTIEKRIVIE